MAEEETVDSTSEEEVVVEETTEEEVEEETKEEDPKETIEEVKEKLAKAEEVAANQKIRAEKAEKKAKEAPEVKETGNLSQEDIIFLAKADIHEDDISDVTKWAENNKITVKEAYSQYKPMLEQKAEERKTADATVTKSARGVKNTTSEDKLKRAEKSGEIDESDFDSVAEARMARKKAEAKS